MSKVPYVDLAAQHVPLKDALLRAVEAVLDHGQFILGPEVTAFERRFAALCGTRFAVGLNSGLDALVIALRALDIGPGDEVITPPNSFLASTSCVPLVGATPVFVDVRDDYTIDPDQIEAAITPRTKAIIPVHLTGRPADMAPIGAIAAKHGLAIVEDAAQSVGALYDGRPTGSLGTAGCFSLHPLKNLNACGDAGVLTTDDERLAERFRLLRNHGLATRDNAVEWGFNSRLDTIQAAMLLVKLDHLAAWTEARRANAAFYRQALGDLPEIGLPTERANERCVYHTFVVQAERRDDLRGHLERQGIGTAIHYPIPIHHMDAARNLDPERTRRFPVAEAQAARILTLPIHQDLTRGQLATVADAVRTFYRR